MAVTALMYGLSIASAFNKEIDWASDDIRVMLLTSSYTPNQDTHQYVSSLTGEVTGTGYTAGGVALANKTMPYNTATNQLSLKADNVQWANSTITARYAVIYNNTPAAAADKPLIGYVDFGANQSSSAGTFEVVWNAAGIFQATVA